MIEMATKIDDILVKLDTILDQLIHVENKVNILTDKCDEANRRLIDVQLVLNILERETKNKRKSSKMIYAEENIKIDTMKYQTGSFDERIYQTHLPKIKNQIEKMNQLRKESIALKEKMDRKETESKLKLDEPSCSNE